MLEEEELAQSVQITAQKVKEKLHVSSITDLGTKGNAELFRSRADRASEITPESEASTWSDFQEYVEQCYSQPRRYIFRGQSAPWLLRTAFHRTSRKDTQRYLQEDITRIRNAVIGKTPHHFRLEKPEENGAFLHLLQHHGLSWPQKQCHYLLTK
ncbi:FRG domain-containing protein [Halocynthiibacter sp. C4]|uniref:FRG domain-containing protein n=1 Tax=Halocynthiibacter sp. C4 TaxID=2992758 RepID=UPI00406C1EBF